ncbi:DNA repair exonuclease [Neobacillus sp. OS1-33]|uniref:metallophosphoesterase family protein n=1 Tax=Neobacillus sp. OS1-33 TaxID=3070683 RepID=UPI0027DEC0BE|nr:DNA repair exonuclease [Neobacillus sp. OS1-33]WML26306.1 DNA repair exonuclease [Neobacillus sp. OS1-33]
MFKFIHCADLHLDSALRGLSSRPDAPVEEIRNATRRALENLVNLSIQEEVKFVIIAGDVYDGNWKDQNTGIFFNSCMSKLNNAGIIVFLISGNHDAASKISHTLVPPPNVKKFSVEKAETNRLDDLEVAIHGQGFKHQAVHENLALSYPDPVPNYLNIGVLHTSVQGQSGHDPYAPCTIDDLVNKGYDYWALGHIHQRQVLNTSPYIIYPGNIQGRHIRETGNKGCTLVTVNDGMITSVEHKDLDVLRWELCTVDLTGAATDDEYVSAVISSLDSSIEKNKNSLMAVRVVLHGQTELHGRLLANADHYRAELVNAINMIPSARIWIEKVKFETSPLTVPLSLPNHTDSLSALENTLQSVDEDFLGNFLAHAKSIQAKISAYTRTEEATSLESVDDVKALLGKTKDMLHSMMVKGGTGL